MASEATINTTWINITLISSSGERGNENSKYTIQPFSSSERRTTEHKQGHVNRIPRLRPSAVELCFRNCLHAANGSFPISVFRLNLKEQWQPDCVWMWLRILPNMSPFGPSSSEISVYSSMFNLDCGHIEVQAWLRACPLLYETFI